MRLLVLVVVLLATVYRTQGWVVYPCRLHPLGMQNEDIQGAWLSASSSFNISTRPQMGRLMHAGGWAAATSDPTPRPWIQVTFPEVQIIVGIKTQGRSDESQWVRTFQIWYKIVDGPVFFQYGDDFVGNEDQNTVHTVNFDRPYLIARWVRIVAVTWNDWPAMRFELMGCPQNSRIRLDCDQDGMRLRVPRNLLPDNLPAEETHLMDTACRGTEVVVGGVTYYQWTTTLNGCNTTCFVTPNFFHYYNLVSNDHNMDGLVIWRRGRLRIPFVCSYRTNKVITGIGMQPNISVWTWGEHAFGLFPCYLTIYLTEYVPPHLPTAGPPVPVGLNVRVYVQLQVFSGDMHVVLRAQECWATPNSDPTSLPRYYLIQNGDAVDPTVLWHPLPPEQRRKIQRFSFRTFVLLKNHLNIYIHCRVVLCKEFTGFCENRPGKRGLKSKSPAKLTNEYTTIISQGPIRLTATHSKPKAPLVHHEIEDPQANLPDRITHKEALGPVPGKYKLWEDLSN